MSAEGSFSFRNDWILQTSIQDGVFLRLKRISSAVARVYFVNDMSVEVDVPEGFQIVDHTNRDIVVERFAEGRQDFALGWTDSYSLIFGGTLVLSLRNDRQWSVHGVSDRVFSMIETAHPVQLAK